MLPALKRWREIVNHRDSHLDLRQFYSELIYTHRQGILEGESKTLSKIIAHIEKQGQQPVEAEPINCPMCNKYGQHNQVAAEIADMPIEEFTANCEKLKALPFSENWSERDNHYFLKGTVKGEKVGADKMKAAILTAIKELLDPEHCVECITAGDVISTIEQTEV
jgi:hypothetical protein